MKFNAEVQVEYMLEEFSEKLHQLVGNYKKNKGEETSENEVSRKQVSYIDQIYWLTERYVRARVVAFIPITYAKSCMEQIYIKYFESLYTSPSKTKEEVQSHFLKIINTEIDHEISKIADEDLSKLEVHRAMDMKEMKDSEKKLDIKMTREEALELLDKLLSYLPDFCAYDISLFYVQKLSIPEIAKRTNVSVDRVNKKLEFGRQHIKNQLRVMQSKGEINTHGMSLQKFFDWLVEFESTNVTLDSIKRQLHIDNQKNIDYNKVKQRYKNVLLESYEEDTQISQVFERRLRAKKQSDAEDDDSKKSTISENEVDRITIPSENIEVAASDKTEKVVFEEAKVVAFDEPEISTSDKAKEAVSDEAKVNTSDEQRTISSDEPEVSILDKKEEINFSEKNKQVRFESKEDPNTVETVLDLDVDEMDMDDLESGTLSTTNRDASEANAKDLNVNISDATAKNASDTLPEEITKQNMEVDAQIEKNEKNILYLLLSLIGAVGAAIIYYLVHLLR